VLARAHLGRLACAHKTQPYIVPVYFAYDDGYLYGFSTVGQKICCARAVRGTCVGSCESTWNSCAKPDAANGRIVSRRRTLTRSASQGRPARNIWQTLRRRPRLPLTRVRLT
jgi:hypothetical protein